MGDAAIVIIVLVSALHLSEIFNLLLTIHLFAFTSQHTLFECNASVPGNIHHTQT